jgi:anti-sigma factor RsiW
MHINDEALRAYLDGQLDGATGVADHVQVCAECRARLDAMQARAARVSAHLAALDPRPAEYPRSPQLAFAEFTARRLSVSGKEKVSMLKKILSPRLRPVWAGLSIILILSVALSFAPVRAWAGSLLGLFRVQQILVVPVDTTRLRDLGGSSMGEQISQLLSDSTKVTKEPGEPRSVADAAQASQLAGFTVRLPASRSDAPQLSVQDSSAFEFTVNRDRAQVLLDEAGLDDVELPAALDGATITVDIPAGVTAAYGDCPQVDNRDPEDQGSPGRRMINCIMLAEIPSPNVTTPPDMDAEQVRQLAEIGLQFSGMTPEQAHEFSQTVDWTSTLVVPIPRNGAAYQQVSVDGVTGNLIQRPTDDSPQYLLMWVKDGIIYAIGGLGSDTSAALEMANSLK